MCGGCLALHKEAFKSLSFDPWIARGEDLDYMLDLRMYGSDIWFDNQWSLRHLPPETESEGTRFGRTSSAGSTSTARWNTAARRSTSCR